jgi:replicative DNA helicase
MSLEARVPPHDLGSEAVVLSESIEYADQFALIADKVAPEDFYSESNRWIYRAIGELTKAGIVVDTVAIAGWLRDRERLAQCGGAAYLAQLVHDVPAGGFEQKAARVLAFSRARKLIATAQRIAAEGYGVAGDCVQQFLDEAERDVFEIAQGVEHARDAAPMSVVMEDSYKNLVRAEARGQGNVELPTGLARLDEKLGGLQRGGLYVVAARPGMGKTSLATGVVDAVASVGALAAVFSLEMPREDLGTRMTCCRAGVDLKRAIDGRLTDRERCD